MTRSFHSKVAVRAMIVAPGHFATRNCVNDVMVFIYKCRDKFMFATRRGSPSIGRVKFTAIFINAKPMAMKFMDSNVPKLLNPVQSV